LFMHYIITGDADEVCSKEVLESQNIIKSFVPQLTGSKSGNHDYLDKEQLPKVICLVSWRYEDVITCGYH
jgi:hypothetical protein